MTEKPLKTHKAGAGRKASVKRAYFYAKIFLTEADYKKLCEVKKATGRSLQDLGNTAINEYVEKFGGK